MIPEIPSLNLNVILYYYTQDIVFFSELSDGLEDACATLLRINITVSKMSIRL